eukprot:5574218-Pleurochrysis_carterae.AAC.2
MSIPNSGISPPRAESKWTPARIASSESAGSDHTACITTRDWAKLRTGRCTASSSLSDHEPSPMPPCSTSAAPPQSAPIGNQSNAAWIRSNSIVCSGIRSERWCLKPSFSMATFCMRNSWLPRSK